MTSLKTHTDRRGVTTLTLTRPNQHNALNRELIKTLTNALEAVVDDTRILLLKGEGRSFCAGADIRWMQESVNLTEEENKQDAAAFSLLLDRLNRFPAPTVAAINGAALGGGVGLVSCCDMAVSSDTAVYALSEVRLGLIPATISPYVIAAIGPRAARRYFMTAERFNADVALRMGLVHELCALDELESRLDALLGNLLASAPEAQRESKDLIDAVRLRPLDESLRLELINRLARIRAGAEAQEGLTAFLDKREPSWRADNTSNN